MKWQQWKWFATLGLLLGGSALGQDRPAEPEATVRAREAGAGTREWLERQRQGRQAAGKAQSLSGPVQEQVYERYRKSFSHPIPQRFDPEPLGIGTSSR